MGDGKYGRKLKIPEVLECRETRNYTIKLNEKPIFGRPSVAVLKLIELGMRKGLLSKEILKKIIHHGFDRGYWSDVDITIAVGEYFFKDMNKTKQKRILEVMGENDGV